MPAADVVGFEHGEPGIIGAEGSVERGFVHIDVPPPAFGISAGVGDIRHGEAARRCDGFQLKVDDAGVVGVDEVGYVGDGLTGIDPPAGGGGVFPIVTAGDDGGVEGGRGREGWRWRRANR